MFHLAPDHLENCRMLRRKPSDKFGSLSDKHNPTYPCIIILQVSLAEEWVVSVGAYIDRYFLTPGDSPQASMI